MVIENACKALKASLDPRYHHDLEWTKPKPAILQNFRTCLRHYLTLLDHPQEMRGITPF